MAIQTYSTRILLQTEDLIHELRGMGRGEDIVRGQVCGALVKRYNMGLDVADRYYHTACAEQIETKHGTCMALLGQAGRWFKSAQKRYISANAPSSPSAGPRPSARNS